MSVKYVKDTITMVKELGGEEITIVPCTVGKLVAEAAPRRNGSGRSPASRNARNTA